MIHYQCGQCGDRLEAPDGLAGHEEECPSCGAANTVQPPSRVRGLVERMKKLARPVLGAAWLVAVLLLLVLLHVDLRSTQRQLALVADELSSVEHELSSIESNLTSLQSDLSEATFDLSAIKSDVSFIESGVADINILGVPVR